MLVRVWGAVWHCGEGELEGAGSPTLCGVLLCGGTAWLGRELQGLGGVCAEQPPCGEKPGWEHQAVLRGAGKVSLGVTLGPQEHRVTQGQEDRCCGDAAGVAVMSGRCHVGVGTAAWGRGSAAACLQAGEWGEAGGGSGSASSPLCHAEMGYKPRFGNKGFNKRDGKRQ